MTHEPANPGGPAAGKVGGPGLPATADRAAFEAELGRLRTREKAHTREGDGRQIGLFHLVCYLRDGDRVFETYWTTRRGAEAMDYSYALMDLTVYGRQESWENSPPGWPQQCSITRTAVGAPDWPPVPAWPGGRPIAQWPRLQAGRSDDLGTGYDGR
jgi:hypothetical protein